MRFVKNKNGFTLVELLIGVAIMVIVATSASLLLATAFKSWRATNDGLRLQFENDALDTDFARDIFAMVPEMGFMGDLSRCEFWTLFCYGVTDRLEKVSYEIEQDRCVRRSENEERIYNTKEFNYFSYVTADGTEDNYLSKTNAPIAVDVFEKNSIRTFIRRSHL